MPLRFTRRWQLAAGALVLVLAVAACGGEDTAGEAPTGEVERPTGQAAEPAAEPEAEATAITEAARAEAKQIFATRCYTCHGERGQGDGPGSAGLDPQPRDLTDPAWQESVNDEHIEQIILYGGAAVGRSPAMPANPDLSGRPAVVAALVEHVRNLPDAGAGAGQEGGAR